MTDHKPDTFRKDAERVARDERDIQAGVDRQDAAPNSGEKPKAMQAGAREYPAPPLPQQHLKKPGLSNMALKSLRVAWPTGRGRLGGC